MRHFPAISLAVPLAGKSAALARESREAAETTPSPMDAATFRELYSELASKLRAYIRRACGDAALTDDLLQETFYRFLRADLPPLERWQRKAYLYRTASALLTDHWRRLAWERRWRLERIFSDAEPAQAQPDEHGIMPLFRHLKPREQTLLWLAYVEGFDHREIAKTLQLSEKSVRVLLFRARKHFAELFRAEGHGDSRGGAGNGRSSK
jgi:RNA polymerase sigma-70 factor (ECF subfamily)